MKKNVADFKVKNQRVIIRCDLNVPIKDGVITDDTRIKASLIFLLFNWNLLYDYYGKEIETYKRWNRAISYTSNE